MALLRRTSSDTPTAVLEREHNDLLARRSALEQKLAQANDALREALDQRRQSLLGAGLDDIGAYVGRDQVRDAQNRQESLADALRELAAKITDVEARLAVAREAGERQELARAIEGEATALEVAVRAFAATGAAVVPLMQTVAARLPTMAADFVPRVRQLISELPCAR